MLRTPVTVEQSTTSEKMARAMLAYVKKYVMIITGMIYAGVQSPYRKASNFKCTS